MGRFHHVTMCTKKKCTKLIKSQLKHPPGQSKVIHNLKAPSSSRPMILKSNDLKRKNNKMVPPALRFLTRQFMFSPIQCRSTKKIIVYLVKRSATGGAMGRKKKVAPAKIAPSDPPAIKHGVENPWFRSMGFPETPCRGFSKLAIRPKASH